MINPSFPYLGNQAIITSDRVHIITKDDGIYLWGNKTVHLSSPMTINMDSDEKVLISSPKIELGDRAEDLGQPIILGRDFIQNLMEFTSHVKNCGELLQTVGTTNLGASMAALVEVGTTLQSSCERLQNQIGFDKDMNSKVLSNTTYTR